MNGKTIEQLPSYREDLQTPGLVLGTAGLGGAWGEIDKEESLRTLLYALEQGIERLDTAPAYQNAEKIVGEVLGQWRGGKPIVSTKVGKLPGQADDDNLNNYDLEVMEKSIEDSLARLGCDQLDLLFLHEPQKVPAEMIREVVAFLENLTVTGKVKSIGLGGIVSTAYYPYIEKGVFDVVMGFNNLNACTLTGIKKEIPYFRQQGLILYQGSALNMGLLGNRYLQYIQDPPGWLSPKSVENAQKAYKIAKEHGLELSTLAHRYLLSIKEVDHLVIGARNMAQLKSTLADCRQGVLPREIFDELTDQVK